MPRETLKRRATILIVEDDAVDLMGIKRALKLQGIDNPVRVARDGVEALEILRGENGQSKIFGPYVVLLDLNMPRMSGLELMGEIRRDDQLKMSPIFVLTTSSSEDDIIGAYSHNVAGYIVKSDPVESFGNATKLLQDYCELVELPPRIC